MTEIIDTNEMTEIAEIYNRLKNNEWVYADFNDIHKISVISIYKYKNSILSKKKYMLHDYLDINVSNIVVSYLDTKTNNSYDEPIEYESCDEKYFHERVIAQLKAWNDLRKTGNILHANLFISCVNHLINETYKIHEIYNKLNIIDISMITIYIPPITHYRQTRPNISLYRIDTGRSFPITGIGIIINDTSSILIVVRDWDPYLKWICVIYKLYLSDLETDIGNSFPSIMKELNSLGKFYITQ